MNSQPEKWDEIVEKTTQKVVEKLFELGVIPPKSAKLVSDLKQALTTKLKTQTSSSKSEKSPEPKERTKIPGVNYRLAAMIDHTLLKPDASREELVKLCEEAKKYSFATVCVNSANVELAAELLQDSEVKPIAVVGFPLGAASAESKAFEARQAIQAGAREIDMVINIGALKSKDYPTVFDDIQQVAKATQPHKLKVIIETAMLDNDEKIAACVLSKAAGAAFVKTSTGFAKGGATVEDVKLMHKIVGPGVEVKASGGIKTKEDVEAMIKAGASRIGASSSVAIVTGGKESPSGGY